MAQTQYELTQQDRNILNLLSFNNATTEARSRYNTVNGQVSNNISQMSIEQVTQGFANYTVGAYNLSTRTIENLVQEINLNKTMKFTPEVQDYIALTLLLSKANYDKWKSGNCSDTEGGDHEPKLTREVWTGNTDDFNHAVFLLNLSKIFPNIPIPIELNDSRAIDSSYYKDYITKTNSRTLITELKTIFAQGSGRTTSVSFVGSEGYVPSTEQRVLDQAGGGQDYLRQGRPHLRNPVGSLESLRSAGVARLDPESMFSDVREFIDQTRSSRQLVADAFSPISRLLEQPLPTIISDVVPVVGQETPTGPASPNATSGPVTAPVVGDSEADVAADDAARRVTPTETPSPTTGDVVPSFIPAGSNALPPVTRLTPPRVASPTSNLLPPVTNPYSYRKSDPLDNRYDFRLGQKVIDLLINGVNPASSFEYNPAAERLAAPGARLSPTRDISGDADYTRPLGITSPVGPSGVVTPRATVEYNPYEPLEFNTDAYIVRNVIPNGGTTGRNVAVIVSPDGRVAELEPGQTLFRSPGADGAEGEVVTITDIGVDGTVTLSNGATLNRVGQYSTPGGVIAERIDEIAPPGETPSGEFLPIRGTIENDIALLNSLVQEETSYVYVIPIDIGDGNAHYVSSGYYRNSSGDWPYTALDATSRPGDNSRSPEFARDIATRLFGALPPRAVNDWLETSSNVDHWITGMTGDPASDNTITEVNNRIRAAFQERGVQPGDLVAGHKKSFSDDGGFWGLANGSGRYQNGGSFTSVHYSDYADYSHGTRLYWGGVNLTSGERFGPIQQLRSGEGQRVPDPGSRAQSDYVPGPTEAARISQLDNDPEFQAEINRIMQTHGLTREEIYGVIAGESSYDATAISNREAAARGGGYGGLFQMGRGTMYLDDSYTSQVVAGLSPAEQARLYGSVLDAHAARGWTRESGLGILQGAPALSGWSPDRPLGEWRSPSGDYPYAVGGRYWRANPGWRTNPNGPITPRSMNDYYNNRMPPPIS